MKHKWIYNNIVHCELCNITMQVIVKYLGHNYPDLCSIWYKSNREDVDVNKIVHDLFPCLTDNEHIIKEIIE